MKTILVTGASRGIGRCIVENLAAEGNNVILNYNTSEKEAKNFQKQLKEKGYNIEIFKADVSRRNEVIELINFVLKRFNNIDVLINNAGIYKFNFLQDIQEEEWDEIINTNLKSVFLCSQQVCKNMIKNEKGCIINVSSVDGMIGAACEAHYCASKAGINGLTKALARELRILQY